VDSKPILTESETLKEWKNVLFGHANSTVLEDDDVSVEEEEEKVKKQPHMLIFLQRKILLPKLICSGHL
jgi:hypothetical protein